MDPGPHLRLFHRFPFVMFDRCERIEEGTSVSARLISIDDALLEGGGSETFAQSLLVETMAQTAALFAETDGRSRSGMLVGLKRIRFGPIPKPGDVLRVEAKLVQKFGELLRIEGRVSRSGEALAEGEILISLAGGAEE